MVEFKLNLFHTMFIKTGSKFRVQRLVEKAFFQPGTMNLEP
jgi:hypothetical protein